MTAVVSAAIAWRNRQPLPGGIAAMPTRFKSGYGMSGGNGRRLAHRPIEAAIVTDGRSSLMPARWACGADTLDSFALPGLGELQCCRFCRVAERFPRGPMVYRFYDRDDRLIYIGSTICYPQRQRSHEISTRWWPEVVRIEGDYFPTELDARRAERLAIAQLNPFHNKQWRTA